MLSQSSFDFKSETFVKTNRCLIVCVDFELESREVQSVVCQIYDRTHELFANAFTLPVGMYADPNRSSMSTAWPVWNSDTNHSDDLAVDDTYEVVNAISVFRESLSPVLARGIR